jgi:hypothetical protein
MTTKLKLIPEFLCRPIESYATKTGSVVLLIKHTDVQREVQAISLYCVNFTQFVQSRHKTSRVFSCTEVTTNSETNYINT